jgi:multimeric flavodoxin WrbA
MDSNRPPSPLSKARVSRPVVLSIYGSPRIRGNTDLLMDAFVEGLEAGGARAERVYLRNLKFSPCREIYACLEAGRCALADDMQPLYEQLRTADSIALATPVMFYGVSAQAKAFIDRCQALWCLKYKLGRPVSESPIKERKGVLLSVGGSRGLRAFDGLLLTFQYFLDAVDGRLWKALTYRGIDEKGEVSRSAGPLEEARAAGLELAGILRRDLEQVSGEQPSG